MNESVVSQRARAGQVRVGAARQRRIPPLNEEGQAIGQRRRVGRPARRNANQIAEQPAAQERPVPEVQPLVVPDVPIAEPVVEEHPEVEVQPLVAAVVRRRGRPRQNPHPIAVQPVPEVDAQSLVAPLVHRRGRPRRNPFPIAEQPVALPIAADEGPLVAAPYNIRCAVCLFNAVNRIFVPCGHTFCSKCVERFTRNYPCPQCRTPFQTAMVFFLP